MSRGSSDLAIYASTNEGFGLASAAVVVIVVALILYLIRHHTRR